MESIFALCFAGTFHMQLKLWKPFAVVKDKIHRTDYCKCSVFKTSIYCPTSEPIVSLVLGESRLEKYLSSNPPNELNIYKANEELPDSKRLLLDALTADPKVGLFLVCLYSCVNLNML